MAFREVLSLNREAVPLVVFLMHLRRSLSFHLFANGKAEPYRTVRRQSRGVQAGYV